MWYKKKERKKWSRNTNTHPHTVYTMKVFQRPKHILKYNIRYGLAKDDLHSCIRCGQHCLFVLVISYKFPVCKKEQHRVALHWPEQLHTVLKSKGKHKHESCWKPLDAPRTMSELNMSDWFHRRQDKHDSSSVVCVWRFVMSLPIYVV